MGGIVVVGDEKTVNCFKLAGLEYAHPVRNAEEAEECLRTLSEKQDLTVILITERTIDQMVKHSSRVLEEIQERKRPLIVPIPDMRGGVTLKSDLIVDLIRRKTGIEVKLQ